MAPPAPRLRRVTPQGATSAARQSRLRDVLDEVTSFSQTRFGGFSFCQVSMSGQSGAGRLPAKSRGAGRLPLNSRSRGGGGRVK